MDSCILKREHQSFNTSFSFLLYTSFPLYYTPAPCAVSTHAPASRIIMSYPVKSVPLVAAGHTRPVTHLSFSPLLDDGTYLLISGCKDGNPMLREWTGDWIGTFLGHKGAVWSTKLSPDASKAASGSADFTAFVLHASCFQRFC